MIAWPQPKLVMAGTSHETLTAAMDDFQQCGGKRVNDGTAHFSASWRGHRGRRSRCRSATPKRSNTSATMPCRMS